MSDAQFYMDHPELIDLKEYISSLCLSDEDIKEWAQIIDEEVLYENNELDEANKIIVQNIAINIKNWK